MPKMRPMHSWKRSHRKTARRAAAVEHDRGGKFRMQMNSRTLVSCAFALTVVATSTAATSTAWGQGSKAQKARNLQAEAMEDDFLATEFKSAEKKLKKAIKLCKKACSDELKAELRRDLGVLYIAGMSRPKNGRAELKKALGLDPHVPFDTALLSDDVKKQILKAGARPEALLHDPPIEAATGYPVPISVATLGNVTGAEAWLVYRRIGEGRWNELLLTEGMGEYEGYIPCDEVADSGSIEYFIELREGDEIVSQAFSSAEPAALTLASDGNILSLRGEPEPDACNDVLDLDEEDDGSDSEDKERKLWFQAGIQQDFAIMGGKGMCSAKGQEESGYYCFNNRGRQYTGTPDSKRPTSVATGLVPATTRFLAGLDYVVSESVSVGASLGFATGGGPPPAGGSAFVPVHVEGRAAYWFVGERALPTRGIGMYGVGAAGFAQLDAEVNVTVHEAGIEAGENMVVWRKMGRQFIAVGAGGFLPLGNDAKYGAARLEMRYMLTLPDTGAAFSPSLSYAYGF
jgi:hypothetical protein